MSRAHRHNPCAFCESILLITYVCSSSSQLSDVVARHLITAVDALSRAFCGGTVAGEHECLEMALLSSVSSIHSVLFFPHLIKRRCIILIIAGLVGHVKRRYSAIIIIICISRQRCMIRGRECPVTQSSQASWPFEQGSRSGSWWGIPALYALSRVLVVLARTCHMTSSTYRQLLSAFRPCRRNCLCSIATWGMLIQHCVG